jgi:hypothetical protein
LRRGPAGETGRRALPVIVGLASFARLTNGPLLAVQSLPGLGLFELCGGRKVIDRLSASAA